MKCDERANGCLNCERLQLTCVQHGGDHPVEASRSITGIKRKRTFRVCIPCRQSKIKCSGERPVCSRCEQKSIACAYDAEEAAEPAWVHAVTPAPPTNTHGMETPSMSPPRRARTAPSLGPLKDYPPSLAWYDPLLLGRIAQMTKSRTGYFYRIYPQEQSCIPFWTRISTT